jgi:predicted lipoprotein with Yx(FWY)xxD motif
MNPKNLKAISLTAAAAVALSFGASAADKGAPKAAVQSTPPGITLQALGRGQGWDLGKETASVVIRDEVAYTDARGMTIYTHKLDAPGKSNCTAACTEKFKPVAPLAGVAAFGDWSIITRDDGAKQWALQGRPLYTYVEDVDPGSIAGNSAARFGARRMDGSGKMVGGGIRGSGSRAASKDKPMPENWTPALMIPSREQYGAVPNGVQIEEVLESSALGLVDHRRHTLYVFEGNAKDEGKLASVGWSPLPAPAIGFPIGDFSIIARNDGTSQWAYKGKGLYTYHDDQKYGDAYGMGADARWKVATVQQHFLPDGVKVQPTLGQGYVWATSSGQTLYKRDGHIYQSGGGHSLHRGQPHRPAVGRDIGVNSRCGDTCDQWTPFLASADAQPQGYWTVYTRDDGKKQWAYMGYALYTYAADKKPGDMLGHDIYDMELSFDPKKIVNVGTPMDGVATLVWAIAHP